MANLITGCRILLSLLLLFARTFSPGFLAVYLLAGVTDMLDGFVARRTNTAGAFGARLDTAADMCLTAAAACKFLPLIRLPVWLWLWTGGIALIKGIHILAGWICGRGFPAVHSKANKAAGLFLFLFPLSVPFVNPAYGAFPLCVMATFAAVQEGILLRKGTSAD